MPATPTPEGHSPVSVTPFPCSVTLRVWELKPQSRQVTPTDCNLGQLKRIVKCIHVSEDDQYMYCGTTSGDVLQVGGARWVGHQI